MYIALSRLLVVWLTLMEVSVLSIYCAAFFITVFVFNKCIKGSVF